MSGQSFRHQRPGWVRDVEVPQSLDELKGPTQGTVGLPLELYWSGQNPAEARWDLSKADDRRDIYEIVLREGTLADAVHYVNSDELIHLWEQMYLPPWVEAAWEPLIYTARRKFH